jgi:hypothetical protein
MIYLSHPIRATGKHTQEQNCEKAISLVTALRRYFPWEKFYVPAETEPFVQKLYVNGQLSLHDILSTDCEIIQKDCKAVIFVVLEDRLSDGMKVELDCCIKYDKNFMIVRVPDVYSNMGEVAEFLDIINEDGDDE